MALKWAYSSLKWPLEDLERNLALLVEHGWEGWETRESLDWLGTPKRLRKMCESIGIQIAAVSGPNVPMSRVDQAFEINKRRIEYASDLGVSLLMTKGPGIKDHPTSDEGLQHVADMYNELARHGEPLGVTVNYHPHINHFVDSKEEWIRFMPLLDECRLCMDMSHAVRWGYDPVEATQAYGDRISLVHLHDEKEGEGADIGEGPMCDYAAFLKAVQAVGYDDWVVVCPGGQHPAEKSISSIRKYLGSIGYL
jgi:sugar phosphate isomerase/epimerase